MTSQQKGIRQPLGPIQSLDRMISSIPPELSNQQTRNLKIIYAKRKLQVDIPVKWTVNKVKCMLCTHFDILNFDKFEFQCSKMLIPGKTLVANLPDDELIVTQADCPGAYEKYYKKTIKKVINQHHITTQSTILPILNEKFSNTMTYAIPKGRKQNLEPITHDRHQRRQQEEGVIVINIFRLIGLAFLGNIIFSFASYWQIGVLIFIACLYYLIDEYVRENERRRKRAEREAKRRQQEENKKIEDQKKLQEIRKKKLEKGEIVEDDQNKSKENSMRKDSQNQNQTGEKPFHLRKFSQNSQISENPQQNEQQKPETIVVEQSERQIIKAKLKLWMAFVIEVLYCYILSIFPNWTVETHLHANQEIMDELMDEVKRLDPEASEQIKKWEIKNTEPQPQNQDQYKPKVDNLHND